MHEEVERNLANSRNAMFLVGIVFYFVLTEISQSWQGALIILSGVMLMFGALDWILLIYLRAKRGEENLKDPIVLALLLLLLVLLLYLPFDTMVKAIRYFKAEDHISYALKDDTAVVRKVYGGDEVISINDTYRDKPVTIIYSRAIVSRKNAQKIILPSNLKEIRKEAIVNCPQVSELVLPEGLESIGKKAFYGCTGLKRITIPTSVKDIPKDAFKGCPDELVIVGALGSAAEEFAKQYYTFEPIA